MKVIYIKLFGGLRLYTFDGLDYVERPTPPDLRPIIAFLVIRESHEATRREIADRFYPQRRVDQSPAAKLKWLRQQILPRLQSALHIENEDTALETKDHRLGLDKRRFRTDARLLKKGALNFPALSSAELEALVACYEGEYLAGYEDWISQDGAIPPGREADLEGIYNLRKNYRSDCLMLIEWLFGTYLAERGKALAAQQELSAGTQDSEARREEAKRLQNAAEANLEKAERAANRALQIRREEPTQAAIPHILLMRVYALRRQPDKVRAQCESYERECQRVGIAPEENAKRQRDDLLNEAPPPLPPPLNSDPHRLIADALAAQGHAHWSERTYATLKKSIRDFEHALEHWPNHVDARAGIADAYNLLYYYSFMEPHQAIRKAREYLDEVSESEAEAPQILTVRAWIATIYDRDWTLAQDLFRAAKEKDPDNPAMRQWHSFFLLLNGRFDESRVEISEAYRDTEKSRQAAIISKSIGQRYHYAGRYSDAVEAYLQSLAEERHPRKCLTWHCLGLSYEQQAREALDAVEKAEKSRLAIHAFHRALRDQRLINYPLIMAGLGHACARSGEPDEAKDVIEQLRQRRKDNEYVSPVALATVYMGLDGPQNRREARHHLEAALEQNPADLTLLNIDPRFDTLRSDSEFADIFNEIKTPRTLS